MLKVEKKLIQFKELDAEGAGSAVFATFDVVDHDNDITKRGAFGVQNVVVLPTHDFSSVPLGKGKTREEGNEAIADFQLNLDIPAAKEWRDALAFDLKNAPALQEWSYSYKPIEYSFEERDGETIRILEKIEVIELSPVIRGAGIGTRTREMKCEHCGKADEDAKPKDDKEPEVDVGSLYAQQPEDSF